MWQLSRKSPETNETPHLSAADPARLTRRWRLMVRIRNIAVTGWLGSLVGFILYLPLMTLFPSSLPESMNVGGMMALGAVFVVSLLSLVIFLSRFDGYVQQTFRQKDGAGLGCWIDILFSPVSYTTEPSLGRAHNPWSHAGGGNGPRDSYVTIDFLCSLISCPFGSECALRLHERLYRHKGITGLSGWIDRRFSRSSATMRPRTEPEEYTGIYADARTALLEQLPLLQEETAALLHVDARYALYRSLRGNDKELILVVLRAVPLFGDARALSFLQLLAEGKGSAVGIPEVQEKAQSSLRRLQEFLERANGPQALLRASHAPQAPEEQLLKPVQGISETDPKELLRAGIEGD
jgi:hypothetical protein